VRYPGDQAAERRESFGFDEIALCFAGVQSCFGQPPLVPDFGKQRSKNRCAIVTSRMLNLGRQDAVGH
jgi:hypothetical protein